MGEQRNCELLEAFYQKIDSKADCHKAIFNRQVIKLGFERAKKLKKGNRWCWFANSFGEEHADFEHLMDFPDEEARDDETEIREEIRDNMVDFLFFTYSDLASDEHEWPLSGEGMKRHSARLNRLAKATIPFYLLPLQDKNYPPLNEEQLLRVELDWNHGKEREPFLRSFVEARNKEQFVEIKKIVCLGLGPLHSVGSDKEYQLGWNFKHHLMVFDIAIAINGTSATKVPIIFQDPMYAVQDYDFLKAVAGNRGYERAITFLGNPRGLLEVDKHTLVLAHGNPSFPVRQIIVDITRDFNGPAGFFCKTIETIEYVEDELDAIKACPMNPPNRRVATMQKDYNMKAVCMMEDWGTMYLKRA